MFKRALLIAAFLVFAVQVHGADPVMKAHFIDVGQGASTLLKFPCGAILIDTGGQDEEATEHLADYLKDFFARRSDLNHTLSAMVISHPHLDHTRGIKRVFEVCRVARYIDDSFVEGSGRSGPKFVRDNRVANNTVVREIVDDDIDQLPTRSGLTDADIDPLMCGDCDPQIRILSGGRNTNPGWTDGDFDNLNNHSVVVRVDFGEASFLFTGDLQEPGIETLLDEYSDTDLLDVDVYLVGHHGSHNATTPGLLEAMTPEIAAIGVGKSTFGAHRKKGFNTFSYGHPRRDIIEMLSAAIHGKRSSAIDVEVGDKARKFSDFHVTKKIYATGWDGDIVITAKLDGSFVVKTTEVPVSTPNLAETLASPADSVAANPVSLSRVTVALTTAPLSLALAPVNVALDGGDAAVSAAEPYEWNRKILEKKPAMGGNGKVILFDVSHGGTAGQSDWVIDGGFSDFADALVDVGYTVREYRGVDKNADGVIRFFDDRRPELAPQNEAVIEFDAISTADVFIMAETNRPLTKVERAALLQFVASGKGLFLIADHYNADRNLNSWDATEVFNGYNRSTNQQFNLGGLYGDMRNPGDATKGWLAENFGIRFRFNAIDCKSGVSDIVAPTAAEGITREVEPLLVAAGSTLAVVEPSRAKGLVYLATNDRVTSWSSAVEGDGEGLYFGGRNEGPFVAISKPNKGKAAFIGDSSPIEDKTAKYLNEQSGGKKRLHDGWNDRGNAADLCLNVVKWLAKPEPYEGFQAANGHSPGTATPTPLAPIEADDPDDGKPWRRPQGGYDPWNSDTFAPGSFGAPFPAGGSRHAGGATEVLTVANALSAHDGQIVTVVGVIQDELNDEFGLKLADSTTAIKWLGVQIPKNLRPEFSPNLKPDVKGKKVRITGKRGNYMGLPGLRDVKKIEPAGA